MIRRNLIYYNTDKGFSVGQGSTVTIRHNLVYVLLMNCDNTRAVDLMVSLIGFNDK